MPYLFTVLAALVLAAGLISRRRLNRLRGRGRAGITDEQLRRIEEHGQLEIPEDEETDWHAVEEEHRRFWEESWDEPEEY
jgi:hypothetical protein